MLRDHIRGITQRIGELHRLRDELQAPEAVVDDIPDDLAAVCRTIEHRTGHDAFEACVNETKTGAAVEPRANGHRTLLRY